MTSDFVTLKKKWGSLTNGDELEFGAELACDFVRRSGRPTPSAFLNGVPLKWDSLDDFEDVVLNQLLKEAQSVQVEAYNGKVNEDTDIFEHLMVRFRASIRLSILFQPVNLFLHIIRINSVILLAVALPLFLILHSNCNCLPMFYTQSAIFLAYMNLLHS